MKIFLSIVTLSFLLSGNAYSATASCMDGECDIFFSVHYGWARTNCYLPIFNAEIETSISSFTIVDALSLDNGETCTVFESK